MKHNTEQILTLINQAVRLCDDFALSNARRQLMAAIGEVNHVAKKRERREQLQKQIVKENQLKEEMYRNKIKNQIMPPLDTNIVNDQQET